MIRYLGYSCFLCRALYGSLSVRFRSFVAVECWLNVDCLVLCSPIEASWCAWFPYSALCPCGLAVSIFRVLTWLFVILSLAVRRRRAVGSLDLGLHSRLVILVFSSSRLLAYPPLLRSWSPAGRRIVGTWQLEVFDAGVCESCRIAVGNRPGRGRVDELSSLLTSE